MDLSKGSRLDSRVIADNLGESNGDGSPYWDDLVIISSMRAKADSRRYASLGIPPFSALCPLPSNAPLCTNSCAMMAITPSIDYPAYTEQSCTVKFIFCRDAEIRPGLS